MKYIIKIQRLLVESSTEFYSLGHVPLVNRVMDVPKSYQNPFP